VSRFRQKATALASTAFFNKRSPAIAHATDERNGELNPVFVQPRNLNPRAGPYFLAKPQNLFAVSVNAVGPIERSYRLEEAADPLQALPTAHT
jgi:hypothetical protein